MSRQKSVVIVYAQSKGGAGKTTAAITFASELALAGAPVTLIDADPNQHAAKWAKKAGRPEKITLIENPKERDVEEHIIDDIDMAKQHSSFVIVDLEGTASAAAGYAISRANLVVIAVQGSQDDADEGAKTVRLVRRQEKAFGTSIPHAILISRAPAALNPKLLRGIVTDFEGGGSSVLRNRLIEREALKAIKTYGGTLHDLTKGEVSGADKAASNVRDITREIVELIRNQKTEEKGGAVA